MSASPSGRVLVLGGTTESSALVRSLADSYPGLDVTLSFAGRTTSRAAAPVPVRVGGFGGVEGMARYLADQAVNAVVDATHPFAAQMPFNVEAACRQLGLPRLRLARPPWSAGPGDDWTIVTDLAQAAVAVQQSGARRVFLTIGRQEVAAFSGQSAATFVVRAIDQPDLVGFSDPEVVLARGPFCVAEELELLATRRIDLVVSKNSGGEATRAKLDAARELGLPVVMVDRAAAPGGPWVASVAEAVTWLVTTVARYDAG